jgi:hypothetical protein
MRNIYLNLCLLITSETACGVKIDRSAEGDNQYRDNIARAGEAAVNRLTRPWLYSDFIYRVLGYATKMENIMAPNNAIIADIVKKRRIMYDLIKDQEQHNKDESNM